MYTDNMQTQFSPFLASLTCIQSALFVSSPQGLLELAFHHYTEKTRLYSDFPLDHRNLLPSTLKKKKLLSEFLCEITFIIFQRTNVSWT